MHQASGGGEAHGHATLAGGQAQAQSDVSFAGAAVADGDDVLPALDVLTPCQFHHQGIVQRRYGWEVEGVQTLHRREAGGPDPPLHHALAAVDELQLGETQQVWGWSKPSAAHWAAILPYSWRKLGSFNSFRWCSSSRVDRSFMPPALRGESYSLVQTWCSPAPVAGRDRAPSSAGAPPLQPAQHQVLHCIEADGSQPEGVPCRCSHLLLRESLQQPEHLHELPFAPPSHAGLQQPAQPPELIGQSPALQRRCLVQGAQLPLQERQVWMGS